tara:strand:+ start:7482 stop:8768 length:1287 start_codon:yes stop_codon:yes gene_type:complete
MRYVATEPKRIKPNRTRQFIGVLLTLLCITVLVRYYNFQPEFNQALPSAQTSEPATQTGPSIVPEISNWKIVKVKKGENLAIIFQRLKLSDRTLYDVTHSSKLAKPLTQLKVGQELKFDIQNGQLNALEVPLNDVDTLTIIRENDQYQAELLEKPLQEKVEYAAVTIQQAMFAAGKKAGVPSRVMHQLAHVFGWEIDFARDLQAGASFSVAYDAYYYNDKRIKVGNIVAAQFINRGKVYNAIRYRDADGQYHFYKADGSSIRKSLLRKPIPIGRISSPFNMHRRHPILGIVRPHTGTDFAAPYGTPIHATGDGRIIFEGWKGGYGRAIMIRHSSSIVTLYGHMSRFAKQSHVGTQVKQNQVIGYIGQSGLATGPHVHYEVRVNGGFKNPMTVRLPTASPLPRSELVKYIPYANEQIKMLQQYKTEHPE